MNPSGGQIPPSKQPPDPRLEYPAIIPSSDSPKIVGSPHLGEDPSTILPPSAAYGTGRSFPSTNGIQSRASPYDRSPGGGATRRKGSRFFRRENTQIEDLVPWLNKFSLICGQDPIPAPQAVKLSVPVVQAVSGSISGPGKVDKLPATDPDEDGFTIVNRKGKNKPIKLQKKKKQVVVRNNYNGLKSNLRNATANGDISNQVTGPGGSKAAGSGFNFARAVQGVNAKPVKPPFNSTQSPGHAPRTASRHAPAPGSAQARTKNRFAILIDDSELEQSVKSPGTDTVFSELDIHASIKRSSLVEVTSDLYPHEPMNEDVPPAALANSDVFEQPAEHCLPATEKLVCQVNREHIDGARLLPASILSSPSPGGIHTKDGGKSYGISEAQRKAIADRLSESSSICSEETVNWCPGEWDYFNDLCISLGLDPDYCIEDVESDTENGTAQFLSDLLNSGRPKSNRKSEIIDYGLIGAVHESPVWSLHYYLGCTILSVWVMGQLESILTLLGSWPAMALKPIWVLFWHVRFVVIANKDSPRWAIWFILEAAHEGVFLGKPAALLSAHSEGPMYGYFDIKCLNLNVIFLSFPHSPVLDGSLKPLGGSEVEQTTESNSVSMEFDQDATVEIPASQPLVCTGGRSSQAQDPEDTDMNLELSAPLQNFVPKQDAKSVWNSPSAGMESFADKIKKANEIEGLKLEYFPPSISDDGCCRIQITQEDLKISAQASSCMPAEVEAVYPAFNHLPSRVTKLPVSYNWKPPHCSHCVTFGHSTLKCSSKPKPMEEGPHSGTKASARVGDSDGFTTVTRRKKMGPFNVQRKKQNPVRVKVSSQQYAPVRSNVNQIPVGSSVPHSSNTPVSTRDVNKSGVNKPPTVGLNVPKKVSKGFNFARAVQGDLGSKSQHTSPVNMISKTAAIPKPVDLVTPNRFSVLDIPNSIKYNKLIGVQDDLYPPDQVLEEGMDVDSNKAICSNKFVCQLNREHVEGSRILPESIMSPPKQAGESSRGKSYGISDKQKMDIADRLKNAGSIKVDIVDQWCPGQWDFFNDLCTLMGLDPDYCIEDVDSDTENGMYQFMSGLPSSDAPKTSRYREFGHVVGNLSKVLLDGVLNRVRCGLRVLLHTLVPFIAMEPAGKETEKVTVRGIEPPDPGRDRRFWSSDESDAEMDEGGRGDINTTDQSKLSRSRKGKLKISSFLDGSTEAALRRYGLRSSDGIHKPKQASLPQRKSSSLKSKDGSKNRNHNNMGKENIPMEINHDDSLSTGVEPCMGMDSILPLNAVTDINILPRESPLANQETLSGGIPSEGEDHDLCNTEHMMGTSACATTLNIDGQVQTNMEYEGDSILNCLSRFDSQCMEKDIMEGDEQEVTSNISDNLNSIMEDGVAGSRSIGGGQDLSNTLNHPVDPDLPSCWENLELELKRVKWSEPWSSSEDPAQENFIWKDVISTAHANRKANDDDTRVSILNHIKFTGEWDKNGEVVTFFERDHILVDCLVKWTRNLMSQEQDTRGKSKSPEGNKRVWLDMGHLVGPKEVATIGNAPKKYKGGKGWSMQQGYTGVSLPGEKISRNEVALGRKTIRIWSSKNRKPDKNMPKYKVNFRQNFLGADINSQAIGCTEFRMGLGTQQHRDIVNITTATKDQHRCMLYRQIAEKQLKLTEIAARINTSSENGLLLSSIRGLSYRNIKRFSAKMNEEEGFTTVRRRKGGGGNWNGNYRTGSGHSRTDPPKTQALKRDQDQNKNKGRGHEHAIPKISNRNVVQIHRQQELPIRPEGGTQYANPVLPTNIDINKEKDPVLIDINGDKGKGKSHGEVYRKKGISVMETTNRFALLDEEGNELGDIQGAMEDENNVGDMPQELHTGWIKKQERTLNARYYQNLSQDQRFEAKRYILDHLIPLDATLSNWPKPLVEYFRHLCSLYNFNDGYQAAVRFRSAYNESGEEEARLNDSHMDDVESETDGTAVFMKSDGPVTFPYMSTSPEIIPPHEDSQNYPALGSRSDTPKSV
ncbi:hypothetical protein L1987_61376 [Smallanthus sonchifolius]|uniref:Uncharacterized protein n=1 Tax=Smallanthus sonchifolius TaxID=185202 RepID=A0ACB9C7F1_9ASTR|nr:hypothetical protein L1987_61376 [Smallanthus sonchifolius]